MKISELKETIRAKVRKKLSEAVIDVTNPATETPATKKSKIDIARRTTGNKNLGTEKDPVEFIEETNKFTADRINKMGRTELIDFLGLTREEARNWSDTQLFGAARELADDMKEPVDEADYLDDDDEVHEGVDDDNTDFKDYDSIYEDDSPDELKKSDALAKEINKAMMQIDDSMSYTDFALAVAKILADEYGTHNFKPFMSVLSKKLMS